MVANFTVHWDVASNDVEDHSGDTATTPGVGPVWLIPQFRDESHVPSSVFAPRPTSYYLRAFRGWLDVDGRLKNEPGGTPGLRVWCNDPDLFDMDRLHYRVEADLTDPFGRPIGFRPFYFDAPNEDSIVYLALEMPQPGQRYTRGRPGFGLVDLDVVGLGELVFIVTDGTELGPVPLVIPELADAIGNASAMAVSYAMTFGA